MPRNPPQPDGSYLKELHEVGGCLVVRIPKDFLADLRWEEGMTIRLTCDGTKIVIQRHTFDEGRDCYDHTLDTPWAV